MFDFKIILMFIYTISVSLVFSMMVLIYMTIIEKTRDTEIV